MLIPGKMPETDTPLSIFMLFKNSVLCLGNSVGDAHFSGCCQTTLVVLYSLKWPISFHTNISLATQNVFYGCVTGSKCSILMKANSQNVCKTKRESACFLQLVL